MHPPLSLCDIKKLLNVSSLTLKQLAHKPEKRATYLIETEKGSWIGKTNFPPNSDKVYEISTALSKAGCSFIPEPIAHFKEPDLFLQQKVEGEPLSYVYTEELVKKVAIQLSAFHLLKVEGLSSKPYKIPKVHFGDLREKVQKELDRVQTTSATIHGDFHHGNVLVGEKIYFIDLDKVVYGDPLVDVARMTSSLGRYPDTEQLCELFVKSYFEHSGRSRENFELFMMAARLISADFEWKKGHHEKAHDMVKRLGEFSEGLTNPLRPI